MAVYGGQFIGGITPNNRVDYSGAIDQATQARNHERDLINSQMLPFIARHGYGQFEAMIQQGLIEPGAVQRFLDLNGLRSLDQLGPETIQQIVTGSDYATLRGMNQPPQDPGPAPGPGPMPNQPPPATQASFQPPSQAVGIAPPTTQVQAPGVVQPVGNVPPGENGQPWGRAGINNVPSLSPQIKSYEQFLTERPNTQGPHDHSPQSWREYQAYVQEIQSDQEKAARSAPSEGATTAGQGQTSNLTQELYTGMASENPAERVQAARKISDQTTVRQIVEQIRGGQEGPIADRDAIAKVNEVLGPLINLREGAVKDHGPNWETHVRSEVQRLQNLNPTNPAEALAKQLALEFGELLPQVRSQILANVMNPNANATWITEGTIQPVGQTPGQPEASARPEQVQQTPEPGQRVPRDQTNVGFRTPSNLGSGTLGTQPDLAPSEAPETIREKTEALNSMDFAVKLPPKLQNDVRVGLDSLGDKLETTVDLLNLRGFTDQIRTKTRDALNTFKDTFAPVFRREVQTKGPAGLREDYQQMGQRVSDMFDYAMRSDDPEAQRLFSMFSNTSPEMVQNHHTLRQLARQTALTDMQHRLVSETVDSEIFRTFYQNMEQGEISKDKLNYYEALFSLALMDAQLESFYAPNGEAALEQQKYLLDLTETLMKLLGQDKIPNDVFSQTLADIQNLATIMVGNITNQPRGFAVPRDRTFRDWLSDWRNPPQTQMIDGVPEQAGPNSGSLTRSPQEEALETLRTRL